jgi:CcmD family protein
MEGNVYLIAAYAVFWILTFVLVLSIWVRQRRLERMIAALQAQLEVDVGEAD